MKALLKIAEEAKVKTLVESKLTPDLPTPNLGLQNLAANTAAAPFATAHKKVVPAVRVPRAIPGQNVST